MVNTTIGKMSIIVIVAFIANKRNSERYNIRRKFKRDKKNVYCVWCTLPWCDILNKYKWQLRFCYIYMYIYKNQHIVCSLIVRHRNYIQREF